MDRKSKNLQVALLKLLQNVSRIQWILTIYWEGKEVYLRGITTQEEFCNTSFKSIVRDRI